MVFPATANLICEKTGMVNAFSYDLSAACSGFLFALTTGAMYIESGRFKKVIVVGVDKMSSIVDYTDRSNCILWGDGAGAVILQASEEKGVISTHLHADGNYENMLHVPRKTNGADTVVMEGNPVFKMAVNTLDQIVDETLAANNMQKSDIDWLVPHQANIRILQATAKKLEMSMDRVVVTVDRHGNTSAASIPLALDVAVRDGRIQRGEIILMEAFGGGFTWGSALVRY
jgi:3-oxoacyl-[acyl-carrier-protein] synthase-3